MDDKTIKKMLDNNILDWDSPRSLFTSDAKRVYDTLIPAIQKLIRKARIEELERLKQYNGAYIAIGGKRVNNMVHHQVIDDRIEQLQDPNAKSTSLNGEES